MANTVLIDTWGWLTLNDAGEQRHQEVAAFYRTLLKQKTLIDTTTFILDETFTLFFKRLYL
jgi:predicted nucleic acid-binding protein